MEEKKLRTAAYCRVSTPSDTQDGSFEVQCEYFENLIKNNPGMEFVGVYRYWACYRNESSKAIYKIAPAKTMKRNYPSFHTLDPDGAIDNLIEIREQRIGSRTS